MKDAKMHNLNILMLILLVSPWLLSVDAKKSGKGKVTTEAPDQDDDDDDDNDDADDDAIPPAVIGVLVLLFLLVIACCCCCCCCPGAIESSKAICDCMGFCLQNCCPKPAPTEARTNLV